jgi:hypothetical protein
MFAYPAFFTALPSAALAFFLTSGLGMSFYTSLKNSVKKMKNFSDLVLISSLF